MSGSLTEADKTTLNTPIHSVPIYWTPAVAEGDLFLKCGSLLAGEVFWIDRGREWMARGFNICQHRSNGHATREQAQIALLTDALAVLTESNL